MPERKKLDLRRQPITPAPAAVSAPAEELQPMLGSQLFQPGKVLDPRRMTKWEREQLASIGWEEGTPVPGNAAQLIAAIQQEAVAEGVLPVPADTPPLQMPTPIDISKLPADKQRAMHDALRQASHIQQQLNEQQEAAAGLSPGIAEAVRVATNTARANQSGPGIDVVDDRPVQAARPNPSPAPTATARPKPTGWPHPVPPDSPPQPPKPPPEPPPKPKPAGRQQPFEPISPNLLPPSQSQPSPPIGELSHTGAIGITHCPHCSWDLKRPDPTEPSDDDKRGYLIAALGGPGSRFSHEASLLGGTIKVGYRELTGNEADAALTQIADDVRKGRVVGDGEWWQRLMDYRMAQAIEYIDIQNVGRVHEGVDLDEIESDDGNPTPYPALIGYLLSNILHSEGIRRAVGQSFMRFQRLCEKLDANADSESFWNGIGSRR